MFNIFSQNTTQYSNLWSIFSAKSQMSVEGNAVLDIEPFKRSATAPSMPQTTVNIEGENGVKMASFLGANFSQSWFERSSKFTSQSGSGQRPKRQANFCRMKI